MAKIKSRSAGEHKTKPKGVHKRAFERVYWPYIPIVLAVAVLLIIGSNTGSLQAYARHPFGRVLSYSTSMSISGLLADTNAARAANGVASLKLNSKLDAAAQANADDMAARDYWSHYTPDGNPPWIWVTNQGYAYQKLGQNLATGFSDEQSTINGWMASPEHRANMLDSAFKDVGFGFANDPNYTAAGGGPMTIVVAFYGEPQVLAATTPKPAQSQPVSSQPFASQPAPPAATAKSEKPAPAEKPKAQPAANTTTTKKTTPPVKTTRVQVALANSKVPAEASGATIVIAILLLGFWASRHMRALHRFFLKGERYAIRHPLTDIGILIIGCLLFILSQTAGLIQ